MSKIYRRFVAASLPFLALVAPSLNAQSASVPEGRLPVRAALVLTQEFCTCRVAHGAQNQKSGLEVGKVACVTFEPALKGVFAQLVTVSDPHDTGDAQLILIPTFVDAGVAVKGVTAFSNQELNLLLQWRAKNASGKTVWLETVQGSATHHVGNMFTARKNLKLIINDAVKNLADESASRMSSSLELRKFSQ